MHPDTQPQGLRPAGAWLAVAALLLVAALAMHPPPDAEPRAFMQTIATAGPMWVLAHWLAAAALAGFAIAGLLFTSTSRGTAVAGAWGILVLGAVATMFTAVAEATVISRAAQDGDFATFAPWQRFAEGAAMGFAMLALAVAVIAYTEARSAAAVVPRWSAGVASLAGAVAFTGWMLGMVLGMPFGAPMWLVGALVMGLWLAWYGLALARTSTVVTRQEAATHA